MKLAEALIERKAAQEKIGELSERLQRVLVVQEGERPVEEPAALLSEIVQVAQRLETLIVAINRTNIVTPVTGEQTLTEAIAHRDVLLMRRGVIDSAIRSAGSPQYRTRGSEIKFVVVVDVTQLHQQRDALAKEYRELDTAIQAANWSADLVE